MTEAEWLACEDPVPMLRWMTPRYRTKNRYRYRTALLFGLACVERASIHRGASVNWLLRRAEELADGISDAEPHITAPHVYSLRQDASAGALLMLLEPRDRLDVFAISLGAVVAAARPLGYEPGRARPDLRQEQAALLRDVFGNPFRRIAFSPAWRTATAVALATRVYEWRDFSALPILADALQDAGCDSADVLDHCRGPGPHVRGCWVVDLVLGKE